MKKVNWGLLSTANINRRLIPAIRASKRGELTAVASRTPESAITYAEKWEIPHAFGSYEEMFDSELIDAVYISLPNHLHAEWSIKAMEHGLHVLCEKPFALTLDEVDAMTAASKKHDRVLAEAFMYRHHPQTKTAGEWALEGRLGEILSVNSAFNFAFGSRDNIRLAPELGGGSLWDVGVYPVSFAQFIFQGLPESVSASQVIGPSGVDESFGGLLHYSGGKFAQITSSFQSPYHTRAEIIGTEGRLVLSRPFTGMDDKQARMVFFNKDGEARELPIPQMNLYLGEVRDMHAAICDGAQNYITLDETRNHVKTVLALYEAANSGKTVKLA